MILLVWFAALMTVFFATRGAEPGVTAAALGGLTALAWAVSERLGGRDAPVWPASALGITGALSAGFAASLLAGPHPATALAAIAGTAAAVMAAWLFRFRLPGLVSPVVTFAVVALFLGLPGDKPDAFAGLEGVSARGILAALITHPVWAGMAGAAGLGAALLARRLDWHGDAFGLASARPLHMIGAGVAALVAGRALAALPAPVDAAGLALVWAAAFVWALRINRVAVLVAIHLAIGKPLILAILGPLPAQTWAMVLTGAVCADLALWPLLHQIWQRNDWTRGPGGRRPVARPGLWWRYWPYA